MKKFIIAGVVVIIAGISAVVAVIVRKKMWQHNHTNNK